MLEITIPEKNGIWDDEKEEFLTIKECHLKLEHSLISVRKWEEKWKKPFLSRKNDKTKIEVLDYIRCMSLDKNVDLLAIAFMPPDIYKKIIEYIKDPMTATTFQDRMFVGASTNVNEVITAEVIYCWMIMLNIPIELEKWHLEKLLTLIKTVNIKSNPNKKMNKKDSVAYIAALNAERKKKYNTKG